MGASKTAEPRPIGEALAKFLTPPPASAKGSDRAARWEIEQREQQERAKIARRAAIYRSLVRCRGERYASARLENFEAAIPVQREAVKKLQAYVANINAEIQSGRNLIFLGPCGTGKDHLAFALCHAAVAAFRKVLWVNGVSLWSTFRRAIAGENGRPSEYAEFSPVFDASLAGNEKEVCRQLQNIDVLAISDPVPPAGQLSEYQAEKLFEVIDHRYSHLRPTIVTLNCANRQEAEQRIGAQTIDRLAHGALVITCNWPSYRQRKSA